MSCCSCCAAPLGISERRALYKRHTTLHGRVPCTLHCMFSTPFVLPCTVGEESCDVLGHAISGEHSPCAAAYMDACHFGEVCMLCVCCHAGNSVDNLAQRGCPSVRTPSLPFPPSKVPCQCTERETWTRIRTPTLGSLRVRPAGRQRRFRCL